MIKSFQELRKHLLETDIKQTAIVAAAHDTHTLEAVLKAEKDGVIQYLLVGHRAKILEIGKTLGVFIPEKRIVDAETDETCAQKSVELARQGKGNLIVKGMLQTSDLLKAAVSRETGIQDGAVMSHVAILDIPAYPKLLMFADAGMIINPDLETKKEILKNTLKFCKFLGYHAPKVAAVCAVETVNPKMPETLDAFEIKKAAERGEFGNCQIEGPISFDLAVLPESVKAKNYKSPVAGDADIILVPNLACGNTVCKALYGLAGGVMAGCVLGAKVPITVNSRGATSEEKYYSILIAAAIGNEEA